MGRAPTPIPVSCQAQSLPMPPAQTSWGERETMSCRAWLYKRYSVTSPLTCFHCQVTLGGAPSLFKSTIAGAEEYLKVHPSSSSSTLAIKLFSIDRKPTKSSQSIGTVTEYSPGLSVLFSDQSPVKTYFTATMDLEI